MNRAIPFVQSRLFYGGDYNPEQWPETVWQEDITLMKDAGVNLATLGVFAWAQLEPRPGVYTFDWMDRIIALLHEGGIGLCLATATASPPPWMAKHHPDSLPVDMDGIRYYPGGRQAYCPHSPVYRSAAAALVRQIAQRYGNHPALKIWHINNEYGCHTDECFCDISAEAFRGWLKLRYGTIDQLNHAWGTSFWSQRYDDWDEIHPPRRAPTFANPTQQLDWRRFSSDSLLKLMQMEKAILREITPDIPVTTNFLGFFKPMDYWKWAWNEDVVSQDTYPDPADIRAGSRTMAMNSDLMRSLGGGKPWILMEQTSSAVNWRQRNLPKPPGLMRLWSLAAVARGAGGVMFFQWRASRAGAEKFHSGMLPHGGTMTRVWQEVRQLGAELTELDALIGTRLLADVALVIDWENWWALEVDSKPSTDVTQMEQITRQYAALYRLNIPVDFIHPGDDLSRYKCVILPNLYMVKAEHARALSTYVENGGNVIVSFFSGIADENDHIWLGGYPAPFRRMLGLVVEEFVPFAEGQLNTVRFGDGHEASVDVWADVIHLEGAEAMGVFTGEYYAGKPAITRHAYGKGCAYYLGTRLDAETLKSLFARVLADVGVHPAIAAPEGVEVVVRQGAGEVYLFLLNSTEETALVELGRYCGLDMLTGIVEQGHIELPGLGVKIIRAAGLE